MVGTMLAAGRHRVAGEQPTVARANGLITVQMAPDQVVAALSLEFADDL